MKLYAVCDSLRQGGSIDSFIDDVNRKVVPHCTEGSRMLDNSECTKLAGIFSQAMSNALKQGQSFASFTVGFRRMLPYQNGAVDGLLRSKTCLAVLGRGLGIQFLGCTGPERHCSAVFYITSVSSLLLFVYVKTQGELFALTFKCKSFHMYHTV